MNAPASNLERRTSTSRLADRDIDPLAAFLSAWSSLVLPASTLISLPLLVGRFEENGLAVVFLGWTIGRILANLDFGIVGLAIPRTARLLPLGREAVVSHVMRSAGVLFLGACGFTALAGLAALADITVPGTTGRLDSFLLTVLAILMALFTQTMALANGVLYALGRFRRLALSMTTGAVFYLAAIVVLVDGTTPHVVVAITAGQNLIVGAFGFRAVRRLVLPPLDLDPQSPVTEAVVSWPMQGIGIGNLLAGQGPMAIAGAFFGAAGVVAIGIGQQYGNVVRTAGVSLGGFIISRFSSTEPENRRELALRANRAWLALCAVGGAAAAIVAPFALRLWLGADLPDGAIWCSSFAAITAALAISTLVASSYLRSLQRLGIELVGVLGSIGVAAAASLVMTRWPDPVVLSASLAVLTGIASALFLLAVILDPPPRTSRPTGASS